MQKLSEKDIRTLKFGGVCVVAILAFVLGTKWYGHWSNVRRQRRQKEAQLELIDVDKPGQAGLISIVPAFEMPERKETQKVRFRQKLAEQLKKAGIKTEPLKDMPTGKTLQKGYSLLRMQCSAKCKFDQVLNLLAQLNENPHLVGIEEFRIKCDTKNPREVQLDLTVSTAVLD